MDKLYEYLHELKKYRSRVESYQIEHDEEYQSELESKIIGQKSIIAEGMADDIINLLKTHLNLDIDLLIVKFKLDDKNWPKIKTADPQTASVASNSLTIEWHTDDEQP